VVHNAGAMRNAHWVLDEAFIFIDNLISLLSLKFYLGKTVFRNIKDFSNSLPLIMKIYLDFVIALYVGDIALKKSVVQV
jgi:hypothetical protein